jgi:Copper type II ascorbate-dependent monooxygenase, C-terminal domain
MDMTEENTSTLSHTLSWHQMPNNEIDDCHEFKLDNPTPVEIDRITVKFPPGSHHVHIYRSDTPDPDGVHDCWAGIDWTRWHLVLGVQTQAMDWKLPDQLTIPFDAHQQLLVQVHWLNTSSEPIDRNIDLEFHQTEVSRAHVGTVFGVNKQTAMQPHSSKVLKQWCPVPKGASILAMMGHYHGLGTKYVVDARKQGEPTGTTIYNALDEQTFQFKTYEPTFAVPDDTGLEFECDFNNTRNIPISWGADTRLSEHCNMSAYYYPALDGQGSLFCTVDAAEVASIVAPKDRIAPGTSPVYTVNFTEATVAADTLQLVSSDPTALRIPASVPVPSGSTSVTFEAKALKTANVTITATLGTTSRSQVSPIGGVVLSEVFVGTASNTDQRQWVELSNLTDDAIDLSGYSLGAGQADYLTTRVQLGITLPPRGCAVVGGPLLGPSQPPFDQVAPFQPNLGLGDTAASGIALFDVKADQLTAQTLPFDTLVYGTTNAMLRAPSGQLAPVVSAVTGSSSYLRSTESRWQAQAVSTPRICEVH